MISKVLIVEDDVIISELLRDIVTTYGNTITGVFSKEEPAIASVRFDPPDYAFLDIKLLGEDLGTNVARKLNELKIPFAFITSYADKKTIQEAVQLGPKGYLLKPFERHEVESLMDQMCTSEKNSVTFKSKGVNHIVDVDEIVYIQSDNVYLDVFTKNKKYVTREKLSDFLGYLSKNQFIRTHRSFVINRNYVRSIDGRKIFLENATVPISKLYYKEVLDFLS